jgi:NADH-quinone oxidoreductase subunit L
MFRLWFMTFFGEYRGDAEHHDDGHHDDGHHDDGHSAAPAAHGHGGIHESPRVMLVPLVILAVLSVVGGWIGVPASLGGKNHFDKFLAPVFRADAPALNHQASAPAEVGSPEPQGEGSEAEAGHRTELLFTGISVAGALLGLYLAWLLYYKNPQLPAQIAHGLGGFYEAVVHKYYVDEIYAALLVKPLLMGSTEILWHGVDQNVIDATLDNSASGAREVSDSVRHMQSGNLRSYAGWIAVGAAAVIAYMVWIGTQ